MKILVVDDEPAVRNVLLRILVQEGYEVELAFTGEAALRAYALAPPDLVLLDIGLGPGLTGQEVIQRLPRGANVIIITGQNVDDVRAEGKRYEDVLSGTLAIITKPIDRVELLMLIERVKGL
jgi:two-component system, OmpR family, response regulator